LESKILNKLYEISEFLDVVENNSDFL
jgi:hypothetical protein